MPREMTTTIEDIYPAGSFWKLKSNNEIYILAIIGHINPNNLTSVYFNLISLRDGNRYDEPITVRNLQYKTPEELTNLRRLTEDFQKISGQVTLTTNHGGCSYKTDNRINFNILEENHQNTITNTTNIVSIPRRRNKQ